MKFNEKLIELRKKGGLSQEDLGYQFNVTRQTISKWELGQTTPEMEKLIEISKFFNVSVDELINDTKLSSDNATNDNSINNNDNVIIEDQNVNSNGNEKKRRSIIVITIIVLILLLGVGVISSMFKTVNNTFDNVNQQVEAGNEQAKGILGLFNRILDMMDKQIDEMEENDKEFEDKYNQIQNQINQNQEEMNNNENDEFFNQVLDGINQTKNEIEQDKNDVEVNAFNSSFKVYQGTKKGIQLKILIDNVVTNNKTETRKVTVVFEKQTLIDVDQIRNIKTQIEDFSDYEIDLQYDDEGYITQANIVKL